MNEWINVKDKLPLYKQCILILLDNGCIADSVYRGEYEKGLYVFRIELLREDIECKIGKEITHWMPLPEFPK
jgi:hypothetical protein